MIKVPNQNGKVLKEMLADSISDAEKTTLRGLPNFQNGSLPFASFCKTSHHSFYILSYGVESITNGSVGQRSTLKLEDCLFKLPGVLGKLSDSNCYVRVHVTYSLN